MPDDRPSDDETPTTEQPAPLREAPTWPLPAAAPDAPPPPARAWPPPSEPPPPPAWSPGAVPPSAAGPGSPGEVSPPAWPGSSGPPQWGGGGPPGPPPIPPALPLATGPAPRGVRAGLVVVVALVVAMMASALTAGLFLAVDDDASGRGASRLVDGEPLDIQALLDKAQPSVVAIETGQRSTTNVYGGAGSGVVVSDDGLVLTNAHVIGGATEMRATTSSGRTYEAELVGSSPEDDVALIRLVDASGLVPAELGSADDAEVGDEVVAIGNALNLGGPPSVTQGIVSAKERVIEAPQITLQGLLQTDAAINPGNSGGPLLNAAGQVIGINTAIIDDAQNIGFAIPIDSIRPLLTELEQGLGQITPDTAFLGVITIAVDQVNPSVLDQYEVETDEGVFVSELVAGSAAVEAGLQLGDVIVAVDGDDVQRPTDVQEAVQARAPGDEIELEIEREGRRLTVAVTLGSRGTTGD